MLTIDKTNLHILRVQSLDDDGYVAYCPSMKPVRAYGKTRDQAAKKIQSAMKLYPELKSKLESIIIA